MSVKPHYFIGIPFPAELAEPLYHSISSRPDFSFHKWVHPLDYHFTLVFLGSADQDQLSFLEDKLGLIASDTSCFELHLRQTGTFGKPSEPRILYVEPEHSAALFQVREQVKQAAAGAGFKIEKRPFHPHMTVARKWSGAVCFHGRLDPLEDDVSFTASRLTIFQTHVDQIPKYEHKAVFPFGG
ncbi:RNA 2',3'-cyclic phosphodiesterase [Bacillus sonorensis]|uniref:RNA 2',3'-cyclic phosphodiesterase n=1 Tax=Bacillus sonorensis TaxID=119858 RepID=UPI00227DFEB6|nr:RNA 2',3'-cyclic phosphodiesterase [Bacillus sonorensis]MCY7859134.1 RNA 2',3'-cyclic phosphodiesterase [Bacillus sonorensis]MCY8027067.1 RNA 2',3'-cyclic phosphodiesterase [Bacillus sonorensis]MCY8033976.1 RNA 2',3'-cyclic phosphodiesterase [Bacillus sonorensis]MCY8273253.1 RNA 2',3'-cyclic phosphodiesterase [Bacillus sonorensis]MCY8563902.1 RNA 2',3'-cyclic phosphodiesterase [Bacillus sonorensis]